VHTHLQCIGEGGESSTFFFIFPKKKVVSYRIIGLRRDGDSIKENPIEI